VLKLPLQRGQTDGNVQLKPSIWFTPAAARHLVETLETLVERVDMNAEAAGRSGEMTARGQVGL
jgi:hypothetical protein